MKTFAAICITMQKQMQYIASSVQQHPETVHVNVYIQTKWLCLDEYFPLEEEEYAQLNQKYRQLLDEN